MQLRPPDFQLVPKWTYAELQQPGVYQTGINPDNWIKLHCIFDAT